MGCVGNGGFWKKGSGGGCGLEKGGRFFVFLQFEKEVSGCFVGVCLRIHRFAKVFDIATVEKTFRSLLALGHHSKRPRGSGLFKKPSAFGCEATSPMTFTLWEWVPVA